MKIAKLNIEGYIGGADIMSLFSGEETFNLSKLKKFIDNLEPDVTDIHVYINSGGGSVIEGWAIYDKLKASGKKVTTIGEGIVGSIATVIYMAGDVRKLHENSKFFIHNPYWQPDSPTPMEGDDLIALGEDLKFEQSKILNFYAEKTGTTIDAIEPLMSKATDLTSSQAIELGFAHSIINEFVNQNHYKLVALVDNKNKQSNKNNQKMSNTNETVLAAINKFGSMLAKFVRKSYKNMDINATDAQGNQVHLFIESETEDIIGKNAFLVDTDGNQTAAPDGEYMDESGRTILIANGVVAEAETEVQANDLEAKLAEAKAEIETLKAEKESLNNQIIANKSENDSLKAEFDNINKEFVALKSTLIGAKANFETNQNFDNVIVTKSVFDDAATRIKASKK